MQQVELSVQTRTTGEKGATKALRLKGLVPANIYGPGIKNAFCTFAEKELRSLLKGDLGSNYILELKSEDKSLNGKKVILKNVEREPVSWKLSHADLYEISFDRPMNVQIPVHYTGTPDGVKNDGGILQVVRRSILIRSLPGDIPDSIDVDISGLGLGKSLHIRDVKFSEKLKVLDSSDFTLVSVVEAAEEEAAVVTAVAAEGTATAAGTGAATAAATAAAAGAAGDKKDAKPAAKPAGKA